MGASSTDEIVLVTGATGLHGGAVARALVATGRHVRALTRDRDGDRARWLAQLGAEPVVGDLLCTESLVAAMRGAGTVYAVTTPFSAGAEIEIEQGEQIIAAAREVGLGCLILASVASADRPTGIPFFESKWQIEQQLKATEIPHIVVAPSFFFENIGDLVEIVTAGELTMPMSPSRTLQQLAATDLGAFVAVVLERRQELLGQRIEIAADELSAQQMAHTLQGASGRAVHYQQLDLAGRFGDIAMMYRYLDEVGYHVDLDALHARFPEVGWTTFEAWVEVELGDRLR
jgi:uncharacterized protein YbjT (DUF2867 family)